MVNPPRTERHMPHSPQAVTPPASTETGANDALLRLVADSVTALMAYYSLPGLRCQFANQAYAAYNGHTTQSILGLTMGQAIGDKAWRAIQPYVTQSLGGEHAKYTREQSLPNITLRAPHAVS